MISHILDLVAQWITGVEQSMGLPGIALLMAIESACIPLPSEIIMPFAGYLVVKGSFTIWEAGLAGAFGCVLGSWVAYFVGMYGGRPFAQKYGKYFLLNIQDLNFADQLFIKYGEIITFVSRLMPIIRTFIALPAGIARMNFWRFSIYTFLGSLPWCVALAYLGRKLGENWPTLRTKFHQIDALVVCLIIVGGVFWVRHHFLFLKTSKTS
jgi:membrane protein DedA with SNARE-associated domain